MNAHTDNAIGRDPPRRVSLKKILVFDIHGWETEGYLQTHSDGGSSAHSDRATGRDPPRGVPRMRMLVPDLYEREEVS